MFIFFLMSVDFIEVVKQRAVKIATNLILEGLVGEIWPGWFNFVRTVKKAQSQPVPQEANLDKEEEVENQMQEDRAYQTQEV